MIAKITALTNVVKTIKPAVARMAATSLSTGTVKITPGIATSAARNAALMATNATRCPIDMPDHWALSWAPSNCT